MKRAELFFEEYRSIKSIIDDPLSFMKKRVKNFDLFHGYSDGDILEQNSEMLPMYRDLFKAFNQDERKFDCEGRLTSEPYDVPCTVHEPGTTVHPETSCKYIYRKPVSIAIEDFLGPPDDD